MFIQTCWQKQMPCLSDWPGFYHWCRSRYSVTESRVLSWAVMSTPSMGVVTSVQLSGHCVFRSAMSKWASCLVLSRPTFVHLIVERLSSPVLPVLWLKQSWQFLFFVLLATILMGGKFSYKLWHKIYAKVMQAAMDWNSRIKMVLNNCFTGLICLNSYFYLYCV